MNFTHLPSHIRRPRKYVAMATPETTEERQAAITAASSLIANLQQCIFWLIRHGIYVIGFTGKSSNSLDQVVVNVAASPYLKRLFDGQYALRRREQKGALTIFTWYAERFGVRIEWEETCA